MSVTETIFSGICLNPQLIPYVPPMNRYDCLKESPYTITEVVPGRLWKINCQVTKDGALRVLNPDDHEFVRKTIAGADQFGPQAVDAAKRDIQGLISCKWNSRVMFYYM